VTSAHAPLLTRLRLALAYADEAAARVRALERLVKAPNTGLPIQSPWPAFMYRRTEIARKPAAELALLPAQRRPALPRWRRPRLGCRPEARNRVPTWRDRPIRNQ
jgi:hypothetical protein